MPTWWTSTRNLPRHASIRMASGPRRCPWGAAHRRRPCPSAPPSLVAYRAGLCAGLAASALDLEVLGDNPPRCLGFEAHSVTSDRVIHGVVGLERVFFGPV